jgi:hypothetical protein
VLVQDFEVQLLRPPILVRRTASGFVDKRAFAFRHGLTSLNTQQKICCRQSNFDLLIPIDPVEYVDHVDRLGLLAGDFERF